MAKRIITTENLEEDSKIEGVKAAAFIRIYRTGESKEDT